MANFPNTDVIGFPASGNTAHTHTVVCQAPKGAANQYQNVTYYGDATVQPTGGVFHHLSQRYFHGQVVSVGQ